jgi:hypothetical protein
VNFARARAKAFALSPVPSAGATPTPSANPAEGIISDWAAPISLAMFLILVIGGLVGYMVSRRQRARKADQAHS